MAGLRPAEEGGSLNETAAVESRGIVFVCVFNRERSLVAECLYRDMLRKRATEYLDRIQVLSRGFVGGEIAEWMRVKSIPMPDPVFGQPPPERVTLRLRDRGIEVSGYRSRQIDGGR
jgi:protein-tyrosine-phosphatase